jgi:hypothetical protein
MRRYAKDMAMLSGVRRQLEASIREKFPTLKPSAVRDMAKRFALVAYRKECQKTPTIQTS